MFHINTIVICTDTYFESKIREWYRDMKKFQQGGGGLWYRVFEKKKSGYSQIKPISDKKSWAVLTKKVGPFWTGPFRIWAVLTWAVSDLGRFDYNSPIYTMDL